MSSCADKSFSDFYAHVQLIAANMCAEQLPEVVRSNKFYARIFAREMLRECVNHPTLNFDKLYLAQAIATVLGGAGSDKALLDQAGQIWKMPRSQVRRSRGLTFLAASHLFSTADEQAVQTIVKAAPEYAGLYVSECVIREWIGKQHPLPSCVPAPLRRLDGSKVNRIALGRRVARAFEACYGDSWLMAAIKMGERPMVDGDAEFLRVGVEVAVRAAQRRAAFAERDLQDLRRFVRIALRQGRFQSAFVRAQNNVKIAGKLGDGTAATLVRLDLAEVYRRVGNYGRAQKLVEEADRLAAQAADTRAMAEVLAARAILADTMGQHGRAIDLLEKATNIAGDVALQCRCLNWLALARIGRQEYDKAQQTAKAALSLSGSSTDKTAAITALYVLGRAHMGQTRYAEAMQCFRKSIQKERAAGLVAWQWECQFNVGQCYEAMGREQGGGSSQRRLLVFKAWKEYGQALGVVERQRRALAQEATKAFFSEDKAALYEALVRSALDLGKTTDAVALAERCKGAAFLDRLGARSLERKRARLLKQGAPRKELQRLEEPNWAKVRNPFNLAVTTFKPKTEVLEYYLGKHLACAFLLGRHTPKAVRLSATADEIAKLIDEFRNAAIENLTEEKLKSTAYREPLAKLYKILVKPFEANLANAEMVYIVPHGVLHYLPFQALIDGEGKYLIEKVNVAYTPSLNVLRHCREANMGNKASLLAVANPDTGWEKLPATEKEAAAAAALFGDKAEVAKGAAATEKVVKDKAALFDVLAFPTHGEMVWKDPTQSNLRFTPGDGEDGKWTVEEIFEMDLKANLVVLSACETGLAGGYAGKLPSADDFVGLTRAFMYAGAPSVVGSLWKVADDSAVTLMSEFFRNWKRKGMDKAEALRQAQLAMIRGDVSLGMVVRGPGGVATVDAEKLQAETGANLGRHPYFWAPFVLIGDYK